MKRKYFLNIANGDIVEDNAGNSANFVIYADDGDLYRVREKLGNMHDASLGTYVRAHIPYYPELEAPENRTYDKNLKELYGLLHELGDDHAKELIESLGILDIPGDHLV